MLMITLPTKALNLESLRVSHYNYNMREKGGLFDPAPSTYWGLNTMTRIRFDRYLADRTRELRDSDPKLGLEEAQKQAHDDACKTFEVIK